MGTISVLRPYSSGLYRNVYSLSTRQFHSRLESSGYQEKADCAGNFAVVNERSLGRIISQFKRQKEKLLILCPTIYYIIMMFEEDFDIIVALKGLFA
jgi:hypothetical protein